MCTKFVMTGLQERMNSTLSGLYEALKDLRASEVQDVDFAKTLLILEEVRRPLHTSGVEDNQARVVGMI